MYDHWYHQGLSVYDTNKGCLYMIPSRTICIYNTIKGYLHVYDTIKGYLHIIPVVANWQGCAATWLTTTGARQTPVSLGHACLLYMFWPPAMWGLCSTYKSTKHSRIHSNVLPWFVRQTSRTIRTLFWYFPHKLPRSVVLSQYTRVAY